MREIVIAVKGTERISAVRSVVIYKKRYSKQPLKNDSLINFFVSNLSNKIEENQPDEKYIIPPDNKNISIRKTKFVEFNTLNSSILFLYLK